MRAAAAEADDDDDDEDFEGGGAGEGSGAGGSADEDDIHTFKIFFVHRGNRICCLLFVIIIKRVC